MQTDESRVPSNRTIMASYNNETRKEIIAAVLVKTKADLIKHIELVKPYLKTVQIDIMDNDFVPNKTIGLDELKDLPDGINYEFHWMVQHPENWITELVDKRKNKNSDLHLVHVEAKMDFEKVKGVVARVGAKMGIVFNPETPVEKVFSYEKQVSQILAMTVHPGFSGQKYINDIEEKIRILRKRNPNLNIEVDGGINLITIKRAATAGANKLCAASAIFAASDVKDVKNAIEQLKLAVAEVANG